MKVVGIKDRAHVPFSTDGPQEGYVLMRSGNYYRRPRYETCPNCGARPDGEEVRCTYCNRTLIREAR